MFKRKWEQLQKFQNEHKDLLIMFACPHDDAISISFAGLNGFVKFPPSEGADMGVIINALRASKFKEAIKPFMEGFTEETGIKPEDPNGLQIHHILGGTIQNIGIEKEKEVDSNLKEFFNEKPNVKIKRKSKTRK